MTQTSTETNITNNTKVKKISYFGCIVVLAILCSICFTPIIINSKDAINLIVNVFSILSGFLFMIVAQSITTSLKSENLNEKEISNQKTRFDMRFARLSTLFLSYLIVLLLIFIYFVLKEIPPKKTTIENLIILNGALPYYFIPPISLTNSTILWLLKIIPHIFIGIAFVSFVYSLRLPWALKAVADEERAINNNKK